MYKPICEQSNYLRIMCQTTVAIMAPFDSQSLVGLLGILNLYIVRSLSIIIMLTNHNLFKSEPQRRAIHAMACLLVIVVYSDLLLIDCLQSSVVMYSYNSMVYQFQGCVHLILNLFRNLTFTGSLYYVNLVCSNSYVLTTNFVCIIKVHVDRWLSTLKR